MPNSDTVRIVKKKLELLSLDRATGRVAIRRTNPSPLCAFLAAHGVKAEASPNGPFIQLEGHPDLDLVERLLREWAEKRK